MCVVRRKEYFLYDLFLGNRRSAVFGVKHISSDGITADAFAEAVGTEVIVERSVLDKVSAVAFVADAVVIQSEVGAVTMRAVVGRF